MYDLVRIDLGALYFFTQAARQPWLDPVMKGVTHLGDQPVLFALLGLGVIAFGAVCAWAASRESLPRRLARVIFIADVAWVVGSALVLMLPAAWTAIGIAGIVVVALIVADLAVLEYLGLRRLNAA